MSNRYNKLLATFQIVLHYLTSLLHSRWSQPLVVGLSAWDEGEEVELSTPKRHDHDNKGGALS